MREVIDKIPYTKSIYIPKKHFIIFPGLISLFNIYISLLTRTPCCIIFSSQTFLEVHRIAWYKKTQLAVYSSQISANSQIASVEHEKQLSKNTGIYVMTQPRTHKQSLCLLLNMYNNYKIIRVQSKIEFPGSLLWVKGQSSRKFCDLVFALALNYKYLHIAFAWNCLLHFTEQELWLTIQNDPLSNLYVSNRVDMSWMDIQWLYSNFVTIRKQVTIC